jgi:hypothetical protein
MILLRVVRDHLHPGSGNGSVVAAGIDTANIVMMPGTVASQQLVATYVSEKYLGDLMVSIGSVVIRSANSKRETMRSMKPLEGLV